MDVKSAWKLLADLPPEAQQQVADFIAFLRQRYGSVRPGRAPRQTALASEAFIGMWRDRRDLTDSTAWVRSIREREWGRRRG